MTDRVVRSKPAAAAKVMVTGASLTSVLAMTAAMGSAAPVDADDSSIPVPVDVGPTELVAVTTAPLPLPPNLFADLPPSVPVVGQVVNQSAPAPTPIIVAAPAAPTQVPAAVSAPVPAAPVAVPTPVPVAPVAAPTPIIVEVPTPAPAPNASTSKSN